MSNKLLDLLLIQSFSLDTLIEDYRLFFIGLLPLIFMLAVLVEYFDQLNTFDLIKRVVISILILTSVTSFYKESIFTSIEIANEKLSQQRANNILLMDMFEGGRFLDNVPHANDKDFYKDENYLTGTLKFLKHHIFDNFVNDGFTITVYFISQLCFLILKIVYSLVYYLGIGLIGIPCLIYIFPTMGNVLRGAILSYIWCLVLPHILVFILSMIGAEISTGYMNHQIIGGSATGTALLFLLTLFIAFTPLVTMMLINGSGMAHAGGIIASIGANYIMNLPRVSTNNIASILTGSNVGPKTKLAMSSAKHVMNPVNSSLKKTGDIFKKSGSINKSPNTQSQKNVNFGDSQNVKFNPIEHNSILSSNKASANREINLKNEKFQKRSTSRALDHYQKRNTKLNKSTMKSNYVKGGTIERVQKSRKVNHSVSKKR